MLAVAAGDVLLSSTEGRIAYAGRAAEHAVGERGRTGDGWWLPVDWAGLPHPVTLAPLPRHGLSALPEDAALSLFADAGAPGWPFAPPDDAGAMSGVAASRLDYDPALAASVRDQQVKARRGQSLFRFRVFQLEAACRLTGIARPDLLIASHIKPWRLCETTHERLDGANGLLLTPHVDRLFDRGLIGFGDAGEVLRSPTLPEEDLERLGLKEACARNAGAFSQRQRSYLAWHRGEVFDRGGK